MTGPCTWCGQPATTTVENNPACDRHKHVAERADQAGNLNYRRIKDRHAEQLEMFGQPAKRPRSAIDGDAA